MNIDLWGKVLFSNRMAAEGVEVRVFDEDAPGKVDDDLTVTTGLSDEGGRFTVTFSPARFQDFEPLHLGDPFAALYRGMGNEAMPDGSDMLLPYLQFRYTFNGQPKVYNTPVHPFQTNYILPEAQPMGFIPSVHGFSFPNAFSVYPLPFSVPAVPGLTKVAPTYGLCGGMSSAAYDFYLSGREIRGNKENEIPSRGSRLHRYLLRRAIDTFGASGQYLLKVARWTLLPDHTVRGTYRQTYREFESIRKNLDSQCAVVIALIYERATTGFELLKKIWNNHQVLAYAYTSNSSDFIEIQIYDPNYPNMDDIVIRAETAIIETGIGSLPGLKCVEMVPNQGNRRVRGFFAMAYEPIEPPEGL